MKNRSRMLPKVKPIVLRRRVDRGVCTYILQCSYDESDIARNAGFKWGGEWWTDSPSVALGMVEHAETPELAADLLASVTALPPVLCPEGAPASALVCEISLKDGLISADFPARDKKFNLLIREARFFWNNPVWSRTCNPRMGEPTDRVADVAHRLLAGGFLVRVYDPAAQAKVISGEFEPEQTRWVSRAVTSERWGGWFALTWAFSENLFESAKTLPGAQWHAGAMVCPPEAYLEVADYGERLGFEFTDGARELAEQQRAAVIGGITVTPVKRTAKPLAPNRKDVAEVLAEGGIDGDLLDD